MIIETERLVLRPWKDEDLEPFAALCGDPEVMRYFVKPLSIGETQALIARIREKEEADGFCFRPVMCKADGAFIGMVGLARPQFPAPVPFAPCVEIGWRFARSAWGQGYASEAARAWLRFGFETLELDEIVAFTTVKNAPSRKVMERLGMTYDPADDFDHPAVPSGHPLLRHVLYRLSREKWGVTEVDHVSR
ncbi:GNAT family N-acetyltransferase [Pannonibacter phragmitetus]|uniref:GNAT family N-acetyltransferase n=1 Tax=Pannonibacter phragmitetus TaxID=121719 RepID=UPI003D2EE641